MKINFKNFYLGILILFFLAVSLVNASDLTSTNFIIHDPVIGTFGGYGTSTNFTLISTGHTTLSGYATSASFIVKSGFLYYDEEGNDTITFDLDTSVADGENEGAQSVALGTITVSNSKVSGTTDSVNMIIAELDTNATGGAVVTVRNANGASGLVSTSVPADNISSADGTISNGTENYGLCVITATLTQTSGTFAIATPYSGNTCVTNSEINDIEGLTTTGEDILNTAGGSVVGGHAEISVNGAISGITPAHSDYTDTLTFIATGTF